MTYRFDIVIEKDANGYFGWVPELQDCYTQGDIYEGFLKKVSNKKNLQNV